MKKSLKFVAMLILMALAASCVSTFLIGNANQDLVEPTAIVNAKSSKQDIKLVQKKLKNWGYYTGSVDGIYGSKTKAAVVKFQKRNGLVADGIIGDKTLKAMGISNSMLTSGGSSSSGAGKYSNSDVQLLARLIYAEARGEPYKGQVAVGAVV